MTNFEIHTTFFIVGRLYLLLTTFTWLTLLRQRSHAIDLWCSGGLLVGRIDLAAIIDTGGAQGTQGGAHGAGFGGKVGLVEAEYARNTTVFAVSDKSSMVGITLDQIADIYSGKLIKWPDGTAICPVLRHPEDDNTKQVRILSPAIDQALTQAELRSGLALAVIDQEAADKIWRYDLTEL